MTYAFHKLTVLMMLLGLSMGSALAAPPDHAGKGKDKGRDKVEKSHKGAEGKSHKRQDDSDLVDFVLRDKRDIIRDYYAGEFKSGHCPPGLAKKNNGCLPPGQAKKWQVGHALPGDVIFHDLPDELLRRLGRTPEGYRLVRVGTDILKIGVGTGLVEEAVEGLGGLF